MVGSCQIMSIACISSNTSKCYNCVCPNHFCDANNAARIITTRSLSCPMVRVYAYDQDQNNMIIAGYDKKKFIKSSTRHPIKPSNSNFLINVTSISLILV